MATHKKRPPPPDRARLIEIFAASAIDAHLLRRRLPKLQRAFARGRQADLLLDLLLGEGSVAFGVVDLILAVALLANQLGRKHEVARRILDLPQATGSALPWHYDFRLGRMIELGGGIASLIVDLKYRGAVVDADDPFAAARSLGPRILFPDGLLDALFSVSRCAAMGRERWEEEVRTTFALEHLTSDFQNRATDLLDFDRLLDRRAIGETLTPYAAQPLLCLTFHGGFLGLAKLLFVDSFADGVRVQRAARRGPNEISVAGDTGTALFGALDALRNGKALMVAPDAGIGSLKAVLPVLGRDIPAAEGVAFLAYETGAHSIWFAIVREGERFVAEAIGAPSPAPGERYAAFRKRYFDFIGGRIEDVLTGDPRNLVFRTPWAQILSGGNANPVASDEDEPAR